MTEQYYTAEEVMKLLNKSRSTFYREVEEGIIPSELAAGRKRGRKFPKEAIDAHHKLMKRAAKTKLTFGPTTNNDLWAGYQNSRRIYDEEDVVEYETLLEWREANYDIFMTARDGDERAGGITMIPMSESTIFSLIDGRIKEREIPQWAIRKWNDPDLSVYIPSISITHTGNKQKDADRGIFIIRNTIRWAYSLDRQYDIKKWYAIAASEEGERLVKFLSFEKLDSKQNAYLLTDLRKANRQVQHFLDTLDKIEDPPIPHEKGRTSKTQESK